LDGKNHSVKNFLLTKINRKLTFLFIIVAIIAPTVGIYYFYIISVHAIPDYLSDVQAPMLKTVAVMIIILIAVDAGIIGFFVSRSISKPIRELYNATRKVEMGNYNVRLNIKR
jgi:HAMP domain-containing protein